MARSRYAEPDTPPDDTDTDPAAAYLTALWQRDAARRDPEGEAPGREEVEDRLPNGEDVIFTRLSPSPVAAADQAVHTARTALESAWGRDAVALGNARFELARTEKELAEAKINHPGAGGMLSILLARRTGLAELVERLTGAVEQQRTQIERRQGADETHRALLDDVNGDLWQARAALLDAARAAQDALSGVLRAAGAYRKACTRARARLVEAGFDGALRPNGQAYPTSTGAKLTVGGVEWSEPEEVAVLLRVVWRVCAACGQRGRIITDHVNRLSFTAARVVDGMLGPVPLPQDDQPKPLPMPSMPALRDWFHFTPPAVADRNGYSGPDKPRPRRVGAFTRDGQ